MSWYPETQGLPLQLEDLLRSFGNNGGHSGCTVAEYVDEVAGSIEVSSPEDLKKFIVECLDQLVVDTMAMVEQVKGLAARPEVRQ